MSNVKERPISFSDEMVRAILDGRKTQTRRPIEPVRGFEHCNLCSPHLMKESWQVWWHGLEYDRVGVAQDCPYGKPGDLLSVPGEPGLTLEITELRAERLADISEEDAIAEGAEFCCDACGEPFDVERNTLGFCWAPWCGVDSFSHRAGFRKLWGSIYGKNYPFDSNPWVWVIGFKKIEEKTA